MDALAVGVSEQLLGYRVWSIMIKKYLTMQKHSYDDVLVRSSNYLSVFEPLCAEFGTKKGRQKSMVVKAIGKCLLDSCVC